MNEWLIAGIASLVAGFVSSMGLGGGGILVLYLTLFLNMPQTQAGGINLLFFLPVAAVSIFIHIRQKRIYVKLALKCVPLGMAGACLGVWITQLVEPVWVTRAFALLVFVLGAKELLFTPWKLRRNDSNSSGK